MAAVQSPPPVGSYEFVLRKQNKHDPSIENSVSGYDENAKTRDITHRDGVRAQTVFINSRYFAQRLRCMGWLDVTEQWKSWVERDEPDGLSLARKAKKTADRDGGVEVVDA